MYCIFQCFTKRHILIVSLFVLFFKLWPSAVLIGYDMLCHGVDTFINGVHRIALSSMSILWIQIVRRYLTSQQLQDFRFLVASDFRCIGYPERNNKTNEFREMIRDNVQIYVLSSVMTEPDRGILTLIFVMSFVFARRKGAWAM